MSPLPLALAEAASTAAAAPAAGWPFQIAAVIALAASAVVLRPASTAAKAAWAALLIGIGLAFGVLWSQHLIVLVIALPLVAAAAPLAVLRRTGRGPTGDLARRVATMRLSIAIGGALLFLAGVLLVARGGAGGARFLLSVGGLALLGLLPFHRPSTELLRQTPPDIRVPTLLLLGPALWALVHEWLPVAATSGPSSGSASLPPLLTLWLASFLILAGGDLPRLCSAAFLFSAAQMGIGAAQPAISPAALSSALTASVLPLLIMILLLAKLEQLSGTHETSELSGLAGRLPRFSLALLATLLLLVATSVTPAARLIGAAWLSRGAPPGQPRDAFRIWPIFIPHVIALWGWARIASGLLSGPPRQPAFPEVLASRVSSPQTLPVLHDLTLVDFAAIAAALLAALILSF